jgi:hypothetical protein
MCPPYFVRNQVPLSSLSFPHFLGAPAGYLDHRARLYWIILSSSHLTSQSGSIPSLSFREMDILVLLLVLSICIIYITGAKLYMLAWRRYYGNYNIRVNFGLSYLLLVINILLLVFSIIRIEIALEVLLSLANRALILYQVSCLAPVWEMNRLD